jgi:DNA-directed RNA polymerase subunit K
MNWPNDKLTRFEAARLIGARSLQVSLGAPVLAKTLETTSFEIAKVEFRSGLLPMTIKRKMPNGQHIVVNLGKAIENWVQEKGEEI